MTEIIFQSFLMEDAMQPKFSSKWSKIAKFTGIPLLLLVGVPTILFAWVVSHRPDLAREILKTPPASATTLEQILARPRPIQLETLNTGIVALDKTVLLNPDHPEFKNFTEDGSDLLVYAHLIRHPEQGEFLVDSGLDASFKNSTTGNVDGPGRLWMSVAGITFLQKEGQDIKSQLKHRAANPRAVYFTHLHLDHTTGLPELPTDLDLITGPGEGSDPFYWDSGHLDRFEKLHELDFSNAINLDPLGPAVDVFGDGSFWAIQTPGHTDGHLSFLVNSDRGATLLTGDAIHFRWGFQHGVGGVGGNSERNARAQASADAIIAFAERYPKVTIFFGHQPPIEGKK